MALRALILGKKLETTRAALDALRAKDQEFQIREADLETAIGEAESEDERKSVEDLVAEFESEKTAHEEEKTKLASEVERLERELAEEEAKQPPTTPPEPKETNPAPGGERRDEHVMSMENKSLLNLDRQNRSAFYVRTAVRRYIQAQPDMMAREDVKDFLQSVRVMGAEKRAVNNTELTIPVVMLPMIREVTYNYSKLLPRVNLQ